MRIFVLAILLSVATPSVNACNVRLSGNIWYGVMDAGIREFRFRIEPVPDAADLMTWQLVSLDEGGQIFRLDDFRLSDSKLQFELRLTKASYSGIITDDGNVSTGKWKQAGTEFDLVLKRFENVPADQPVEKWSGTMKALFQELRVRFRVYRQPDGSENAYFDSVSQKASGFKAKREIKGREWAINVDALRGSFKGLLNEDGSEVKGKWTQNGLSFDLTLTPELTPVEEVTVAPVRPQTPAAPFPYAIENITFRNESDDVQLAATLTLPQSDKACAAAILISGSGPQDRDESIAGHKPFWVIADHLSRNGIAVLRFDDRGTGASTGDFSTATSEDLSRDVEAAFDYLLMDPRIRKDGIGLIGHSEGGIIAPLVAARRHDVAFAVLLAGTGVNGREILLSQGQLILRAEGITDETVLTSQRETQLAIFDTLLNAPIDTGLDELVASAMKRLADSLPAEAAKDNELRSAITAGIAQMKSPWFRQFLTHEPGPVLEKVTCPVLALNGAKDVQVDPALNLPAIQEALRKGGHQHFAAEEILGVNHLFQTCRTGGVSEYQTIEETISPVVLKRMTDWIQQNTVAQRRD